MTKLNESTPRQYQGVMVSSTFADIEHHRSILMETLRKEELFAIGMEEYISSPEDDVISSSLSMVRKGCAYIGLISHRYGQIVKCSQRNPSDYSTTQLEFEEAKRLHLPTLIFIMGDDHPLKKNDVETDPEKIVKLDTFRKMAKANRIYYIFNSIEEFTSKAIHAVVSLRRLIEKNDTQENKTEMRNNPFFTKVKSNPIPKPPLFYAEPPYIGSHEFVGRHAQLETISDWANPSDSHCVLLFEAIGGTGKSMLTWEWATKYSQKVRKDWFGRFWYSFYEKGATMIDFCRRALSYITVQPYHKYKEKSTAELTELLIHHLQYSPWLIILDGLERVLVSYHRFDAAQMPDEEAGNSDKIASRNPCAAIKPEDDDLLRALTGANPSKILLTSRLTPTVYINRSNQTIPGVLREYLPGLRLSDAEALIRNCGVTGESESIQHYIKKHCDCHPLVIGVLAGLINDFLPNRGNFDDWASSPIGGGQLNMSDLDLTQKRNHILSTALAALPKHSSQLLSTLALFSNSVDYDTLCALNPFVSQIPEEIPIPKNPENTGKYHKLSNVKKAEAREEYLKAIQHRKEYENALQKREQEKRATIKDLINTVKDLENRGLLQYDPVSKRYDLHPVVRGTSAGGLKREEKNLYGQRVIDYFSQQAQDPYEQAETLEDFDNARHIMKVLFQMGKMEQARNFVQNNYTFLQTLNYKFEAHNEILAIIRPFFSSGWDKMPSYLEKKGGLSLSSRASVALRRIGALKEATDIIKTAIYISITKRNNIEYNLLSKLLNLASTYGEQNRLALEDRLLNLASSFLTVSNNKNDIISLRLARFRQLSRIGRWTEAEEIWLKIQNDFLPIETIPIASHHYAVHLYQRDNLTEDALKKAEKLNQASKSALGRRNLLILRGFWQLQNEDYLSAKGNLEDAIELAHKISKTDRRSEIGLAIAKYHLNELPDPINAAEQFILNLEGNCYYTLAWLWFSIGHFDQAKVYALSAYKWAWADGTPYVRFFELNQALAMLKKLDTEMPNLSSYQPDHDDKLPLEEMVTKAITEIQASKEATE